MTRHRGACSCVVENPEGCCITQTNSLAGSAAWMPIVPRVGGSADSGFRRRRAARYVNRKSPERICVANCAISVLGGIQPEKSEALKLGMSDDGLLQRFAPIVIHATGMGSTFRLTLRRSNSWHSRPPACRVRE